MFAKLCSGTKADGTACRGVALTGSNFCFFHTRQHSRTRRQQRTHCTPGTRLGPLNSRSAVLRALSRVLQAVASGTLAPSRAPALLERIRLATCVLDLADLGTVSLEPTPSPPQTNP
jgi:hypothetical protein